MNRRGALGYSMHEVVRHELRIADIPAASILNGIILIVLDLHISEDSCKGLTSTCSVLLPLPTTLNRSIFFDREFREPLSW